MVSVRSAMEGRAREYLLEHDGPALLEDVVPAMTLTGDLRKASRILNEMIETGVVLLGADGKLSLAHPMSHPMLAVIGLAMKRVPDEE